MVSDADRGGLYYVELLYVMDKNSISHLKMGRGEK